MNTSDEQWEDDGSAGNDAEQAGGDVDAGEGLGDWDDGLMGPYEDWDDDPVPLTSLRIRRDGPSGTVILDRPESSNALTEVMIRELIQAFEDFQRVGAVKALILTGAGDSFCSGTDLRELASRVGEDDRGQDLARGSDQTIKLLETMLRFPKPIIAAVDGPVRGLGLALLLASDIVVASHRATFGLTEPHLGLVATQTAPLLSFRIGHGQAARLLLSSQVIDGAEAYRIGMVHELVPGEQIWLRAQAIAEHCALGAHESLQLTKRLLNETMGEQLEMLHSIGAAYAATARATFAAAEGVKAFVEKRRPDWNRL